MSAVQSWVVGNDHNNNPRRDDDDTDGFVDALENVQEPTSVQQPAVAHTLPMLGKPLVAPTAVGGASHTISTAPIASEGPGLQTAPVAPAASAAEGAAGPADSHAASNVHNTQWSSINPDGDMERGASGAANFKTEDLETLLEQNRDLVKGDSGAIDLIGGLDLPPDVSSHLRHRYNSIVAHANEEEQENRRRSRTPSMKGSVKEDAEKATKDEGTGETSIASHHHGASEAQAGEAPETGHESKEEAPPEKPANPLGSRYIPGMPAPDPFVVYWEGKKDPENPRAWSLWYRVYLTFVASLLTIGCSFASSAPAMLMPLIRRELGTTMAVMKVVVFIYVAGFCLGPLLWAPLSEQFGQRYIFLISMVGFCGMNIGCALSPNTAAMLIFRFFAGCFSSSPLTNSASLIASVWSIKVLGSGIAIFAIAPMAGPCLGPIAGGYILQHKVAWEWIYWSCVIISGVCAVLVLFTLAETHTGYQLKKKAIRVRKETGDDRYYAPIERQKTDIKDILVRTLLRPIKLFVFEPMLIAITVYISFVYGTLYLLFEAYPAVFLEMYQMKPGPSGLTFLGYFIGCVIAVLYIVFFDTPRYRKKLKAANTFILPPEERLYAAVIGAPILVVSLFWFAWTSYKHVSYWSPIVAGGAFGAAMILIFLSLLTYITQAYFLNAASALAANTVVRSAFGVGFPMFGEQMYHNLKPRWATTILAFIALAMLPIPFVLIKFGPTLRKWAKYAS